MFERFTERARRAVVLAQEEARKLDHGYIGTEHLLLGLIREGEGVAAKALESLGISLKTVREQVVARVGRGQRPPSGHIPFTERAKRVLELSLRESGQLGHRYIGTEHVLLAIVREGDGIAAQVLTGLGADLDRVRQQVIELISGQQPQPGHRPSREAAQVTEVQARLDVEVVPILRVADADAAVRWYERLGFTKQWEHRFDPSCPAFVSIACGGARLFLSEHRGDARPDTLVGQYVRDVDAVEAEFGRPDGEPPYGCEFELRDPDGNRLRIRRLAS